MLHLNVKSEEKKLENQTEMFSLSGCFKKEWLSLTNDSQRLDTLICCICNQIANDAMELHCDEHENADQVYLVGEQFLQKYLKQSNGKYLIQQHDHCEFSQSKTVRKSVCELLVLCPRQFNLKKEQIKIGEDGENWSESNPNSKNNCNFKGKIKDLKDHLDKSCNSISNKQNIPSGIVNELNVVSGQTKELQNVYKHVIFSMFEKKEKCPTIESRDFDLKQQHNEQIDNLKHELQKKDQTITTLTKNIQQLNIDNIESKKQLEQYQNKKISKIRKEKEKDKNCENMLLFIQSSNLQNGVDFLLREKKQRIWTSKNQNKSFVD
ncbi:DNA repair protein RecN [Reticulomyxa filosa]|uniref:DNA repair protein RecN n=1 Tax=Reticulomyxa filosa TaxID=46433 RepID=X6PC59_RETFI|nr:DNA repair protein RecN [Reticulomyxa filosa]|eukprot:ETO35649.1 DNA repair protein RecN [Reticulomyxa filosa]